MFDHGPARCCIAHRGRGTLAVNGDHGARTPVHATIIQNSSTQLMQE